MCAVQAVMDRTAGLAGKGGILLFLFPSSSGLSDGDGGPSVDGRRGDSGDFWEN